MGNILTKKLVYSITVMGIGHTAVCVNQDPDMTSDTENVLNLVVRFL